MSAKKQAYKQASVKQEPAKAVPNPLIKTVSEVEKLSVKEKEAFRKAGGTAISNPI